MSRRTIRRAGEETGSALVISIIVMALLAAFAVALLSQVDVQQSEGGAQRARESSFQVAEGALNSQIYQLSNRWPDAVTPSPTRCTQADTASADCPSSTAMSGTFKNVDQSTGIAWTTQVRDNVASQPNFWSDALLTGPTYDANEDGFVWVRSTALVRKRRRTVVALVRAEKTTLTPPSTRALVAGYFKSSNSGNKVIVDLNGLQNEFSPGDVIVRCRFITNDRPPEPNCADYDSGKKQVEPERVTSDPNLPPLTTERGLDALRAAARTDGNLWATGCPTSLQGDKPGETVFIEDASTCGNFNGNSSWNTPSKPGVLVIGRGPIVLNGNADFYGVIYHANLNNSSATLVTVNGNGGVYGAIMVDGVGGVEVGSSKENLIYNPNVWANFKGTIYGTASVVPNTFREISAAS